MVDVYSLRFQNRTCSGSATQDLECGTIGSVHVDYPPCVNPFSDKLLFFTCLLYKSLENTAGKGEIGHYEQFLLLPQCFLPSLTQYQSTKFRLVQIETNCRHFKVYLKWKISTIWASGIENILRKREIACKKQFLLFSQCFPQLYIFSVSKCGIM